MGDFVEVCEIKYQNVNIGLMKEMENKALYVECDGDRKIIKVYIILPSEIEDMLAYPKVNYPL